MKQWMINIILFSLAVIATLIALLKVTPFEVGVDTYIGVIVTLLSVITTFVIGYQIYNAIEFRKEINNQKKRYEAILQKNQEMEQKYCKQELQMQEGFDIISSLISYQSGQSFIVCGKAFYSMHRALLSSIETDRIDYEWIFNYLRLFISEFNNQTFSSGLSKSKEGVWCINSSGEMPGKPLKEVVDIYMKPIKDDENRMRSNCNFYKIQLEYNRIMKLLYRRMNDIVSDPLKEITPEERNAIMNPM